MGQGEVGKRHQYFFFFFFNITLTEKETEARCPDLLGGFCWVLQVLLGQDVPRGGFLQG